VLGAAGNAGTATLQIEDLAGLTPDDYTLSYNGTAYALRRASDGQTVTMTGTGTALDPLRAEGLSIVVTGAASGDSFFLRPTRLAAGSLAAAITNPSEIAAASPLRTTATGTNIGTGSISAGAVQDIDTLDLDPVTIQFLTATTYSINGGAPINYTSGSNIDFNGWRVQITGVPAVGDTFTVQSNAGGVGDGRNALAMGALQNSDILSNGTASISDTFGALVGSVGSKARQADINLKAQTAIASQAREQVLSVSGVNLDEEAADMMRWQQAYQAAAQTISVANTLFQTLIQAFR
jgi:flagellar hook-associated protein 1 FlgK